MNREESLKYVRGLVESTTLDAMNRKWMINSVGKLVNDLFDQIERKEKINKEAEYIADNILSRLHQDL